MTFWRTLFTFAPRKANGSGHRWISFGRHGKCHRLAIRDGLLCIRRHVPECLGVHERHDLVATSFWSCVSDTSTRGCNKQVTR